METPYEQLSRPLMLQPQLFICLSEATGYASLCAVSPAPLCCVDRLPGRKHMATRHVMQAPLRAHWAARACVVLSPARHMQDMQRVHPKQMPCNCGAWQGGSNGPGWRTAWASEQTREQYSGCSGQATCCCWLCPRTCGSPGCCCRLLPLCAPPLRPLPGACCPLHLPYTR